MSKRIGPMLRLVLAVGGALSPLAGPMLNRRLKRGKEDPARLREKLGEPSAERPAGPLIWLHGVGVGEVMALRGLIERLSLERADLNFLVTSSARSSAQVIDANLPARTIHQYLPLDFPGPVARFLNHWQPDLAVWSDQEVWPRLAATCAKRRIPQAYVAARITDDSAKARARFGAAYGDLYGLMDVIHAQDDRTAENLRGLMGPKGDVTVTGSLKAAAARLADDPDLRERLPKNRRIWLAASAHPADVDAALNAQHFAQTERGADWLLIIAPRRLDTAPDIEQACADLGLTHATRSAGGWPDGETSVFIADSFGELGVWYRAAHAALIGGTFDGTEGHNPWEAIALNCPVLHGPRTANFATDYKVLQDAKASWPIGWADTAAPQPKISDIVAALQDASLPDQAKRAAKVQADAAKGVAQIAGDLLALLPR